MTDLGRWENLGKVSNVSRIEAIGGWQQIGLEEKISDSESALCKFGVMLVIDPMLLTLDSVLAVRILGLFVWKKPQ
jgi:hypothetical protein